MQKAQVDFVQKGFNAAQAIDGNPNDGQGWACSPALGSSHLMIVECKEAVGYEGGTKLSFTLRHTYQGDKYLLGRFRISVSLKAPAKLGVPDDILAIIKLRPPSGAQLQEVLAKYFRGIDGELRKRQEALAAANQPLPVDPKLKELQDQVALVSLPVPLDSRLKQLREDVETSAAQLANARLVGAQDLAWALINSPAFLFNH